MFNIDISFELDYFDTMKPYPHQPLIVCLFFLFALFSCKSKPVSNKAIKTQSGQYTINGSIKGILSGKVQMFSLEGKLIDSATISNGNFTLHGDLKQPERKNLIISPGNWSFGVFTDAPNIKLQADTAGAIHQFDTKGKDYPMIWRVNQTGSPMGEAYINYQKETGNYEYISWSQKLNSAKENEKTRLSHQIDSIAELIPIKRKRWIEDYIRKNPSSKAGPYILNEYIIGISGLSADYLRPILNQFSGPAKASFYYAALNKKLQSLQGFEIGKPAPDFTLLKNDNTPLKLSDTRGKIILLDFWASWCIPCRKSIPHWKKIYEKYKSKDFNIISISSDDDRKDWINALNQEQMPWTQVIDEFSPGNPTPLASELYHVTAIPYMALLNKKGELIASSGDEAVITQKIEELLGK